MAKKTGKPTFQCKCGFETYKAIKYPATCRCGIVYQHAPGEPPPMPPATKRVKSWAAATANYVAKGSPSREVDEIAAIFDEQCKPCDRFNGKGCSMCGCRVSRSGSALRNKIAMLTEVCPLGKWGGWSYLTAGSQPRPAVRHLLYHVCPLDKETDPHEGWRHNVRAIVRRQGVFNGRRLVAIACGNNMVARQQVLDEFAGMEIEPFFIQNDPDLREVESFPTLLEAISKHASPQDCFFYAHSKGNSTAANKLGAIFWRNVMYRDLLDRSEECMDRLTHFATVGTHFTDRPSYPSGMKGDWMFAGTFFWMRCDRVFSHPRWREIPRDRYGAEAYPALLFAENEAHSMFQLWPRYKYPVKDHYNPKVYHGVDRIEDQPLPPMKASRVRTDERISVVTASWGGYWPRFGERFIENLARLNPRPKEVVIVSDEVKSLPTKCRDWVRVVKPEGPAGWDWYNQAAREATGEWLAVFSPDDLYYRDCLEGLDLGGDAVCFGGAMYGTSHTNRFYPEPDKWPKMAEPGAENTCLGVIVCRREVWLAHPWRDFIWADWAQWVELRAAGRDVRFDLIPRFDHIVRPDSHSTGDQKHIDGRIEVERFKQQLRMGVKHDRR